MNDDYTNFDFVAAGYADGTKATTAINNTININAGAVLNNANIHGGYGTHKAVTDTRTSLYFCPLVEQLSKPLLGPSVAAKVYALNVPEPSLPHLVAGCPVAALADRQTVGSG